MRLSTTAYLLAVVLFLLRADAGGLVLGRLFIVSGTLLLAGCATSGAQLIGPATYVVSARVPFTGETGAKADALTSATRQCAMSGTSLLVKTMTSSECALHGGCGEAQVTFMCLDKSDPRYVAAKP
jgi:hypothetical protein